MLCKYNLQATGYINVISQLKGKVHNSSLKLKYYERVVRTVRKAETQLIIDLYHAYQLCVNY